MIHANSSEASTSPKEKLDAEKNSQPIRYHYLDNVRALAMLAGIVFHAALAYSPLMHNIWFTTSNESSELFDVASFFLHLFRMPVFFLISGFFALYLIDKRGMGGYLKNRFMRIVLPFIVFFPILLIALMSAIDWGMNNVENMSPMLQFFKMMKDNPDAPPPPLSTMHFWFLFNLFLFSLLTTVLYKLNFFQSKFITRLCSVNSVLLFMPLLLTPALVSQVAPHPAPEKFYPELWSFGFYGIFFIFGGFVFLNQNLLEELQNYKNRILIVAIAIYAYFYSTLPETVTMQQIMLLAKGMPFTWQHLLVAICEAYAAFYLSLYCLLIGKKLFSKPYKMMRLIADSSYWIYLIHLPLLLLIQFILADIEIHFVLKFLISTLTTIAIGLVSYLIFVRWTPIGWLLNGRKSRIKPNPENISATMNNIRN